MTANLSNSSPFLRTSREFPHDMDKLTLQINKSWVDIAGAVNARTIGLFTVNRSSITGEEWFIKQNLKQQTLRQIYTIPPLSVAHGITTANIGGFTRIYGTFTDGTKFYPLPYVDATNAANQINVTVDSTNIVVTSGATAPTITSGLIVLEWLSQP